MNQKYLYGLTGLLTGGLIVWFLVATNTNISGWRMMGSVENSQNRPIMNSTVIDTHFIEQMIPHHQMAVMMASMLKNGTTRPEMKQLAGDIITAQTKEIDQMRKWYKDWGNN